MSPLQVIFAIAVVAAAAVGAFVVIGPNIQSTENDNMVQEMTNITKAVNRFCAMNDAGCAGVTEFQDLTDRAYLDSEFYTDGVGENIRQGTITAVTASATTVTVTYDAGSNAQCLYLVDNDEHYVGVDAAPTCNAAGVLTAVVR